MDVRPVTPAGHSLKGGLYLRTTAVWVFALSIATILALIPTNVRGQKLLTPEQFWTQKSGYAGSLQCRRCHPTICKSQGLSGMALTLRPVKQITQINSGLPFKYFDRLTGSELLLVRRKDGNLELTAQKAGTKAQLVMQWAVGSGSKGITFLGQEVGGTFIEGRLSWYRSLGNFDLTAGARGSLDVTVSEAPAKMEGLEASLGWKLTKDQVEECFDCHSPLSQPEGSSSKEAEMGIHCERCHGPGLAHVRTMETSPGAANDQIFNPARMSGFSMAQMCGVCHGRPPGETDFAAIEYIEQSPLSVRFAPPRLVLSRCFEETNNGLKCTVCHDPHSGVIENELSYDKVCLSCHFSGKKSPGAVCPIAERNCASCHMPRRRIMLHSEFTDHWIRIVHDKTTPGM